IRLVDGANSSADEPDPPGVDPNLVSEVDPNLVSEYLDNTLDPKAVAGFEERCLGLDDRLLAEVAALHRMLSLLGHKMRPSPEALRRAHRLGEDKAPGG